MKPTASAESTGLRYSFFGAILFAALGLIFALITSSQAVLLDGAFNFVTALMALFSIRISALLKQPASIRMPAGYVALEPFYVLVKGLVLLVLTLIVLASNVLIMLRGGNRLELGIIVLYIGIAVIGNYIIYLLIAGKEKIAPSPLLVLEKKNWLVNAVITLGIGVAFALVLIFQDSFIKPFIPYVDQVVVIVVCLISLSVPVTAIKTGLSELLLFGPGNSIYDKVEQLITSGISADKFAAHKCYILKTGRKLWVTALLQPVADQVSVKEIDALGEQLRRSLSREFPENNIELICTNNLE